MMKSKRAIWLLILWFGILSGCTGQEPISPILANESCQPPCWSLITPGITGEEEAVYHLRENKDVLQDSIEVSNQKQYGYTHVYWDFIENGRGILDINDGIVWRIHFSERQSQSSTKQYPLEITLSQAIEKYGEPEVVFSADNPELPRWTEVKFFYQEKGLALSYSAGLEKIKYRLELRPETPISTIYYFVPKDNQTVDELISAGKTHWSEEEFRESQYPWKGYGNISDKYPTAYGSNR